MLTLTPDDILLDCHADDWQAALDHAAEALLQAGLTADGYRDGLHAREAQSSTFLGSAIAIPHGTSVPPGCGCCSSPGASTGTTAIASMCW